MPAMQIYFTARFLRSFKKLPDDVQEDAQTAIERFQNNSNITKIKLHKLSGDMKGYHAFSINFRFRAIIKCVKGNKVYFMDIGTHDVYR